MGNFGSVRGFAGDQNSSSSANSSDSEAEDSLNETITNRPINSTANPGIDELSPANGRSVIIGPQRTGSNREIDLSARNEVDGRSVILV